MELPKDRTRHFQLHRLKILILILLNVMLPSGIYAAEHGEEMKVLHMFFDEADLFSSATRNAKPISQIAENVTLVTANEIEAMNAHSVAEVLNRVAGLFVNFSQGAVSLGSTSLLHLQGSESRHVLVLVDGIPWNSLSGGTAETNTIPVGIIDRIEIVKGPASSSWGSSLGGIVHIITKSPGYKSGPTGSVSASYGERSSQDYRAELSGREGRFGYYLFGGRQESDGFGDGRGFETNHYFSRFSYAVSDRVDLDASIGYSEPDTGLGEFMAIGLDFNSSGDNRNAWGTLQLDAAFTRDLTFNLRLFKFDQKATLTSEFTSLNPALPPSGLFRKEIYDEQTTGGSASLVWQNGIHTAVVGVDVNRGKMDQTITSGLLLQMSGAPERLRTHPDIDRTGVYINDTIVLDRLSVTPGIRYDYDNLTGSFVSPSLGFTYRLGEETLLRGSAARGFMSPPLSWISGGALFLDPNPSLGEERVWSYQAGVESTALGSVWLKGTLFRHEIDDVYSQFPLNDGPPPLFMFINDGNSRRQGVEIEIETLPVYHVSVQAAGTYVNLSPENDMGANDLYTCNIGILYDNPEIVRAGLFGHYIWWDARDIPGSEYDAILWDVNVSKRVYDGETIEADLFLTGHNIFKGSQHLVPNSKNTGRWFEAGLRMRF